MLTLLLIATISLYHGYYGLSGIALVGFWIFCYDRAYPLGKE